MDAETFARAMVDQDEHSGLALAGERGGEVRAPSPGSPRDPDRVGWHLVDALGADAAVVRSRSARPAEAMRRLQPMLAGQAQDPALGGTNALEAQARPDLAITLAVKSALRQAFADGFDQLRVGHRPGQAGPASRPLRPTRVCGSWAYLRGVGAAGVAVPPRVV